MSDTPLVVLKSKFITQGDSQSVKLDYNNFLNYMDRENTRKEVNEYSNYQNYMEKDKDKTSGLFTNNEDYLRDKDKDKYKEIFNRSQKNGSILWQDVISFDNKKLKEIGILNGKDIDEKQLKNVARECMNTMLDNEDMLDNSIWTGAIHYDTDNIHIHFATVQTHNFRERGKRKPSSLEKMKSKVANKLIDRTKDNEKINSFIREKLVKSKRESSIPTRSNKIFNKDMVDQFNKIYNSLPDDKRKWKYNMNAMKEIRPEIDKLTDIYIDKYFKNDYKDFSNQVNKNVDSFKRIYGDNSKANQYKDNVYKDMYSRMGNTILSEMREYDKKKNTIKPFNKNKLHGNYLIRREAQNSVYHLNRYMKDDLQNMKNQREYERLEREQEMER